MPAFRLEVVILSIGMLILIIVIIVIVNMVILVLLNAQINYFIGEMPVVGLAGVCGSGGRLCTLIGVPWRGVSFSTLSTGRFVLIQHICKGAESAEHAETAGYTYEGTPTTA